MSPHVLKVDRLRKVYGDTVAVADVSFAVRPGEIFGILGPNGSGKTTTVECLQGLRVPDGGDIDVLGMDPRTQASGLRKRIGSQLQESALPERMRTWEALDLFAALKPGARPWPDAQREWGLWDRRNAAFGTLSGGQRQRLFIALALVGHPELVFLDEMTTGLDPVARRTTWDLIREVRERGSTVVLVTHFMDEAETLCDRLAVFQAGRVIAIDTPLALVQRFAGQATVTFTSETPGRFGWLAECPGADAVSSEGNTVVVHGTGPLLAHVAAALVARGIAPIDLQVQRQTLEDAYIKMTASEPAA